MRGLIRYLAIPLLLGALAFGGCLQTGGKGQEKLSINGVDYSVSGDSIVQTAGSLDADGALKIGVVSDIEGAIENAEISAGKLLDEGVDAVIIAGDCYENEVLRSSALYPNSTDNIKEMVMGIEAYAELGVPVFVIPGNHELREVYGEAIRALGERYDNVFDINSRSVDLQGINIVGMGGYHHRGFVMQEGFILGVSDYEKAKRALSGFQEQEEPVIFVTHGPPESATMIDYVVGAGHVGDSRIKEIMESDLENIINVHGHIHEGGGNSDRYAAGIAVNVASITGYNSRNNSKGVRNDGKGGNTCLIVVDSQGARYEEIM